MDADWTRGPDGRANTSDLFNEMVRELADRAKRLCVGDDVTSFAAAYVAHLAHRRKMRPADLDAQRNEPPAAAPRATTDATNPLLTIEEVARAIPGGRGSIKTVRGWVADGRLKSIKVGRHRLVRRRDLADFLGLSPSELAFL